MLPTRTFLAAMTRASLDNCSHCCVVPVNEPAESPDCIVSVQHNNSGLLLDIILLFIEEPVQML